MLSSHRPHPLARLLVRAASAVLLTLPIAANGNADNGFCHLTRWTPDVATYLGNAGDGLALNGDLAAYGVDEESAVYLQERQGGSWQEVARIASPSPNASSFGQSIAISGSFLLIGDPFDTTKGIQAGAVFLYERNGSSWDHVHTFYGVPGARYGRALDVEDGASGLQIAVGASGGNYAHRIRPFLGGWIFDYLEQPAAGQFGASLDLDGETLVVGDPSDSTTVGSAGAVYSYHLSNAGTQLVQKVFASDPDFADNFGISVSVADKERLVVGASRDNEGGPDAGAVYVFDYTTFPIFPFHHFVNETKIVPCDVGEDAHFGGAVALDPERDRIAIGAWGQATGGATGGAVHVYSFGGGFSRAWTRQDLLVPADVVAEDRFGSEVCLEGDFVLASSPHADTAEVHGGAVYPFSLTRTSKGGGQCPCDILAGAWSYGVGKPGTLGTPALSVSRPPVPGESVVVKLANVPAGTQPFVLWGSIQANIPFDGGALYIGDPTGQYLPVVGAPQQVGAQWQLPPDIGLCGTNVFFQAMLIDPGAGGTFHTAQSNGLHTVIGY